MLKNKVEQGVPLRSLAAGNSGLASALGRRDATRSVSVSRETLVAVFQSALDVVALVWWRLNCRLFE